MRINLTDNNEQANVGTYKREDIATLFPIAGKKISQLCMENNHLLVFPDCIETTNDRIGNSRIISICNTADPEYVSIVTGNMMGFIGVGNLQIKIKSRFDTGHNDFLLQYMLQRVLSLNLFDMNHNNEQEDVFDFIMFLFPSLLNRAMCQGVYREYQTFHHNDGNVKGMVNVNRHIAHNIPFVGNLAYSAREYAHDNSVTQLIRHTIEYMKSTKYGQYVLNMDRETIDNVKAIVNSTPSYSMSERSVIVAKNLRSKRHPYYTEYQPLQSLCLQILRNERIRYGESDDEICGILFDGAWLWEEYINTILDGQGFKHPENKKGKGRMYLFENNTGAIYPDFYKDNIVLDAKYKRLGNYDKVSRVGCDDIYQLIAYVTRLNAEKGGFVVPLTERQQSVPSARLKNYVSTLYIFGIEVSKTAKSYSEFCKEMKENELAFLNSVSG